MASRRIYAKQQKFHPECRNITEELRFCQNLSALYIALQLAIYNHTVLNYSPA